MDSLTKHPLFGIAFGLTHGVLIALIYFLFKILSGQSSIGVFAISGVILFGLHLPWRPAKLLAALTEPSLLIRGGLLGLTQILFFQAMLSGETSTVMVASSIGSMVAVVLGSIVLGERLSGRAFVAMAGALIGSFINPAILAITSLGILAGLVQGSSSLFTRMVAKKTVLATREMVAATVGVGSFVIILYLVTSNQLQLLKHFRWQDVLLFTFMLCTVQYSLYTMYQFIDTQRGAALTLSRIPAAILLEMLFLSKLPSPYQFASTVIIIASSILMILANKRTARSSVNVMANAKSGPSA